MSTRFSRFLLQEYSKLPQRKAIFSIAILPGFQACNTNKLKLSDTEVFLLQCMSLKPLCRVEGNAYTPPTCMKVLNALTKTHSGATKCLKVNKKPSSRLREKCETNCLKELKVSSNEKLQIVL